MTTKREHLVKTLHKVRDFYLSEWAREGYPADSRSAINANIEALNVLSDPNPELDKQVMVDGFADIEICLFRRRS